MSAELRSNFLRTQIQDDLDAGRVSAVVTAFLQSPTVFARGHAKSINFGLAQQFGGNVISASTIQTLKREPGVHRFHSGRCPVARLRVARRGALMPLVFRAAI